MWMSRHTDDTTTPVVGDCLYTMPVQGGLFFFLHRSLDELQLSLSSMTIVSLNLLCTGIHAADVGRRALVDKPGLGVDI